MLYPDLYETNIQPKNKLEEDLFASKWGPDACVTAYVSKMFAVSAKDLPENKKKPITAEEMRTNAREARAARQAAGDAAAAGAVIELPPSSSSVLENVPIVTTEPAKAETKAETVEGEEVILGFARLYSGTLRTGTVVYGVLPKYDAALEPTHPRNNKHLITATVDGLYVMMGRELVVVDFVRAGNIFAIKGLEGKVWRSATLCAPGETGIGEVSDAVDQACLINLGGVNRVVRRLFLSSV